MTINGIIMVLGSALSYFSKKNPADFLYLPVSCFEFQMSHQHLVVEERLPPSNPLVKDLSSESTCNQQQWGVVQET
jgi:hypothetical protein